MFRAIVKKRISAAIVGVLYLSVAVVFGMLHDDHRTENPLHHHHCAACMWQIAAISDVPMVEITPEQITVTSTPVVPVHSVFVPKIFPVASASRAPPATASA